MLGLVLCLILTPALGQTDNKASAEVAAVWQPPSLTNLPIDWWEQFDHPSQQVLDQRMQAFMSGAQQAVAGLQGADLDAAQGLIQSVDRQFEVLLVARQTHEPERFEPIVTRDAYSLEELLSLRSRWLAIW